MNNNTLASSSIIARIFGAFFYYPPRSSTIEPLAALLPQIVQLWQWDTPNVIAIQSELAAHAFNDASLGYEYSLLFEGQGTMPIPPWGSVYQDKENLLLGESASRYRQFLQQHKITLDTGINEPEDQFGLMLLAFAWLLEDDHVDAASTLLESHLLPWAYRYLKLLDESTISPFYHAMGVMVTCYLKQLQQQYQLNVKPCTLYR